MHLKFGGGASEKRIHAVNINSYGPHLTNLRNTFDALMADALPTSVERLAKS